MEKVLSPLSNNSAKANRQCKGTHLVIEWNHGLVMTGHRSV